MSTSGLTRRQVLAGGVAMAVAGGRAIGAAQTANPPMQAGIQIVCSFDGGLLPPTKIEGDTITFDLKGELGIVNVLARRAPPRLRVRLLLGEKSAAFIAEQGLITSLDGLTWAASPLTKADDGTPPYGTGDDPVGGPKHAFARTHAVGQTRVGRTHRWSAQG